MLPRVWSSLLMVKMDVLGGTYQYGQLRWRDVMVWGRCTGIGGLSDLLLAISEEKELETIEVSASLRQMLAFALQPKVKGSAIRDIPIGGVHLCSFVTVFA